jgi:hypothetical protein
VSPWNHAMAHTPFLVLPSIVCRDFAYHHISISHNKNPGPYNVHIPFSLQFTHFRTDRQARQMTRLVKCWPARCLGGLGSITGATVMTPP